MCCVLVVVIMLGGFCGCCWLWLGSGLWLVWCCDCDVVFIVICWFWCEFGSCCWVVCVGWGMCLVMWEFVCSFLSVGCWVVFWVGWGWLYVFGSVLVICCFCFSCVCCLFSWNCRCVCCGDCSCECCFCLLCFLCGNLLCWVSDEICWVVLGNGCIGLVIWCWLVMCWLLVMYWLVLCGSRWIVFVCLVCGLLLWCICWWDCWDLYWWVFFGVVCCMCVVCLWVCLGGVWFFVWNVCVCWVCVLLCFVCFWLIVVDVDVVVWVEVVWFCWWVCWRWLM